MYTEAIIYYLLLLPQPLLLNVKNYIAYGSILDHSCYNTIAPFDFKIKRTGPLPFSISPNKPPYTIKHPMHYNKAVLPQLI